MRIRSAGRGGLGVEVREENLPHNNQTDQLSTYSPSSEHNAHLSQSSSRTCRSQSRTALMSAGAKLVLRLLSEQLMVMAHLSLGANANSRQVIVPIVL